MRTARSLGVSIALLLSACLAQAEAFVPPWCSDDDVRHAAQSSDGQWVLWTDGTQQSITLFDGKLGAIRQYTVASPDGKNGSRVHAIYNAAPRHSFIVVLRDAPEIWEISYDPQAEPIFDGLVHDYRMGEGVARAGYLGVRRTLLQTQLTDIYFTEDFSTVIGITPSTGNALLQAHVVNLDIRREMATVTLAGRPPADTGISVSTEGRTWRAMPGLQQNAATRLTLFRYCTP